MTEKIPGFKAHLKMMRSRDPQVQDDGFFGLRDHASEFVDELISQFQKDNHWEYLELLGYSGSPKAVPVLAAQLRSEHDILRSWAIHGLRQIGSKESAQILREARYYELSTADATQKLRQELNRINGPERSWEKYTRNADLQTE